MQELDYSEYDVYFFYVALTSALNHNFHIVDIMKSTRGWGEPDKVIAGIGLYFSWHRIEIKSLSDLQSSSGVGSYSHYETMYRESKMKRTS